MVYPIFVPLGVFWKNTVPTEATVDVNFGRLRLSVPLTDTSVGSSYFPNPSTSLRYLCAYIAIVHALSNLERLELCDICLVPKQETDVEITFG